MPQASYLRSFKEHHIYFARFDGDRDQKPLLYQWYTSNDSVGCQRLLRVEPEYDESHGVRSSVKGSVQTVHGWSNLQGTVTKE